MVPSMSYQLTFGSALVEKIEGVDCALLAFFVAALFYMLLVSSLTEVARQHTAVLSTKRVNTTLAGEFCEP